MSSLQILGFSVGSLLNQPNIKTKKMYARVLVYKVEFSSVSILKQPKKQKVGQVYTYTQVYTGIHMYTYTHIHIHTYIHIYI